jgi:hypothetical protein|tara:strand:+ start:247 stop:465 length:219 start_codon:yes stop_codon:yes gene_type:complete
LDIVKLISYDEGVYFMNTVDYFNAGELEDLLTLIECRSRNLDIFDQIMVHQVLASATLPEAVICRVEQAIAR